MLVSISKLSSMVSPILFPYGRQAFPIDALAASENAKCPEIDELDLWVQNQSIIADEH